jgi:hypothetical protein
VTVGDRRGEERGEMETVEKTGIERETETVGEMETVGETEAVGVTETVGQRKE